MRGVAESTRRTVARDAVALQVPQLSERRLGASAAEPDDPRLDQDAKLA